MSLSSHQVVNTFDVVPNGDVGGGIWTSPTVDPATNLIYLTTGTRANSNDLYAEAVLSINASDDTLHDSWPLPANQETSDLDGHDADLLEYRRQGLGARRRLPTRTATRTPSPRWRPPRWLHVGERRWWPNAGSLTERRQRHRVIDARSLAGSSSRRWRSRQSAERASPGPSERSTPPLGASSGLMRRRPRRWSRPSPATTGSSSTRPRLHHGGAERGVPGLGCMPLRCWKNHLLRRAHSISNGEIFAGSTDGNLYTVGLPFYSAVPPFSRRRTSARRAPR